MMQSSISPAAPSHGRICRYWVAGRCSRLPCPFLHTAHAKAATAVWKKPSSTTSSSSIVCKHFRDGRNCPYGDKCRFLHSWFVVNVTNNAAAASFSLVTSLQQPLLPPGAADQGHNNNSMMMMMITGIGLPTGSDKLYTGSKDGSLRAWDCHTGALAGTIHLGVQVGCIITQGHWIFVGIPNAVKAWNNQTTIVNSADDLITLTCTCTSSSSSSANSAAAAGQVYALAEACETLFAGTHSGQILAWRYNNTVDKTIQPLQASLPGHTLGVVSLAVAPEIQRLYSASMDHTIRVWDLASAACIQTLTDHTSAVMSLIRWDKFLLSCSLDNTIKAWHATDTTGGDLQAVYTHTEENGLLTLSGMLDPQGKPVLLCSRNDDTVRLYDLPSFTERGTLFSNAQVRTVHACPRGGPLFFTGDGAGELRVWTWTSSTTDDNNNNHAPAT